MKKLAILILLLSNLLLSQENNQNKDFFSLGLGYNGKFRYMSFNDYNNHISSMNLNSSKLNNPIYCNSFELMTTIGFISNLRMGLTIGSGNTQSEDSALVTDRTYSQRTLAKINNIGIDFDYAIPIYKPLILIPSLEIGLGSYSLNNYTFKTGSEIDWNNHKYDYDRSKTFMDSFFNDFYYTQVSFNAEYALTTFTVIRLGASYFYTFANDWLFNENIPIKNLPSGITANNFSFSFGFYIGIFNY
jgi:hypothetical protein